jgi:hypothetical protein
MVDCAPVAAGDGVGATGEYIGDLYVDVGVVFGVEFGEPPEQPEQAVMITASARARVKTRFFIQRFLLVLFYIGRPRKRRAEEPGLLARITYAPEYTHPQ